MVIHTRQEQKLAYDRAWRLRHGIAYRGPRKILAEGLKFCPRCLLIKDLVEFPGVEYYKNGKTKYGYCKPCHSDYQRPQSRRSNLRKFGLTEDQYEQMLEMQGGVCAVCGHPPKTRRLAVDHDHKTGRVRCLACYFCNRNRIGTNTPESAIKVVEICTSAFDGRLLARSSLQAPPETA